MTEVTAMRMHSAGRIYPLRDLKNNLDYTQKTQCYPRITNSASAAIGAESPRKEKGGFQQAALINIVASVNNDTKQRPATSDDSLKSNMNSISNLFLQRERQISIPKQQVFMEVPHKFSKKKPLFNKKSGHQVTEKEAEGKKRSTSLSRYRPSSREPEIAAKQESINIAVSLQKSSDEITETDGSFEWISSPSKVRSARSNSPRHRYLSLKKKPDQRMTTFLSTCEAIDILDATESFTKNMQPIVVSTRDKAAPTNQDLYRAKSLPALFPVKRRKSSDAGVAIEKKPSAHPFKRNSVKTVEGMPTLLIGKTLQGNVDSDTVNGDDNSQTLIKHAQKMSEPQIKSVFNEEKSADKHSNKDNITLHGRSIPNPRPNSLQLYKYSRNPETDLLYSTSDYDKKLVKQLDKHFEDLRHSISNRMSNLSDCGSAASESSSDITSYNLVGKAFKSNLSTASGTRKTGKQRHQKRVTFADDADEKVVEFKNNSLNYENDRALLNARLMHSKYHFKENDREFSQMTSIKETEFVPLKHRILPETLKSNREAKNDYVNDVRISGTTMTSVRSSSRASDTNRSVVSETDTIAIEEAAKDWNGMDIDATNRDPTGVPLSQGASSFYPTEQDEEDDSSESDEDVEHIDSYRVLKAIDLGKLSNFQHRKFKKNPHKHDPSNTHFVKVKVK